MTFKVHKLPQAEKELNDLPDLIRKDIEKDISLIENQGIEFVKRRFLRDGLFEIKSGKGRSFFKYEEGQLIWIGLIYEKKTQKAPDEYIKLALKRLKEAGK